MSHPFNEHRAHKVEKSRVAHIAGKKAGGRACYAKGGAVLGEEDSDTATDREIARDAAHRKAGGTVEGKAPKHHLGKRAKRAAGGRVGKHPHKGKTIINIHAGGQPAAGGGPMPMPVPVPAGPMGPPPGAAPPMVRPPGMMPPGAGPGGPPTMPMRARGGKVDKGGTPVFEEGRRNGTQVQHTDGKGDTKDIGRGKPITYAGGGKVKNASTPVPTAKMPPLGKGQPAGSGSGEGRLAKAKAARHGTAP